MEKNKTLILLPTYNEESNITIIYDEIRRTRIPCDLLFIDGSSTDSTVQVIEDIQGKDQNVYLIKEPRKASLSTAYKLGLIYSRQNNYEKTIQFDSDGTHNPKDLESLISEDADFVSGIRIRKKLNQPSHRKALTLLARTLVNLTLGSEFKDPTSGISCMSKRFTHSVNLDALSQKGYFIQIQLKFYAIKNNLKYSELPIDFRSRLSGISKMNLSVIFDTLFELLKFGVNNRL